MVAAVVTGPLASPAAATTTPGRMCSGQPASGAFLATPDTADYVMDIPLGATYTVKGSVDILANSGGGGWQTIIHVDPFSLWNRGNHTGGPFFDQTFGPINQTQNSYPDGHVPIHIWQEYGTRINWRVTVTITSGGTGGPCTPLSPMETAGENCAIRNARAAQGSAGRGVNTATGNFNAAFSANSIPGRGPGIGLAQGYNSLQAGRDGPLGFGWTGSYAASLAVDPGSGVATVHQETGAEIHFYPDGNGGYEAPPRVVATLVHNPDGTYTLTRCSTTTLVFSATGQLVSITDRNGDATTLQYVGGRLATVTDAADRELNYTWTGSHVTAVLDDSGRAATYAYDGAGDLTDYTDVAGSNWHFTYDGSHRLLTTRSPRHGGDPSPPVLTNAYDTGGRVTSQTDELLRTTLFDYSSIAGSTKVTDPKGNATVEGYSNLVRTSITRGDGTAVAATWTMDTDASLGITRVKDPMNRQATAAYDGHGNLVAHTSPLNRSTVMTYNAFDEPVSVRDANGVATTFSYDGNANLTSVSTPLVGSSPAVSSTTTYRYEDPAQPGDVTSMVDPAGRSWFQTYDAFGNRISATDPLGNTARFGYDTATGWMTSAVSPRGVAAGVTTACSAPALGCTRATHDDWGRVTSATNANGHTSTSEYDANGNLVSGTDAEGNVTGYGYDDADQPVSIDRADLTTVEATWWPDGSRKSTVDGAGRATSYDYDAQGRLRTTTDPNGRVTSYGYDPAGNPVTKADPGGTCPVWPFSYPPSLSATAGCTVVGYDADGRMTSVTYSDPATADVTAIGYDALGRRTSMTDGTGTSTWSWDSLGRPTSAKDGANHTVGYSYANLRDSATTITYPGARPVTRSFDHAGRMTTVTDWLGNTTGFTPDADSNVASVTFPAASGLVDTTTFDNADVLDTITNRSGGVIRSVLDYGRDDNSQVASVASTGAPADNHSYTYSPLTQLDNVDAGTHAYDAADNVTGLPTGETLSYDLAHQLTNLTRPAGTVTFGFDGRGNRTSATPARGPGRTLLYDQANRLTAVNPTTFSPSVAGGWYHSLAAKSDGTVWATGYNAYGQLGNNTSVNTDTLVAVGGLSGVVAVAGGAYHSLALRSDGTVSAWGFNNEGELGTGNTTGSAVAVPVPGLSGVVAIAAGTGHSLALKADGTVWAWGSNSNGQVGNGSTGNVLAPSQVLGLTNVVALGGGGYAHSVALKADGTVWTWGYNGFGQLGNGSTTQQLVPVQVANLSGVAAVAAGYYHSLALRADGTVATWGYNGNGQLGNNTLTNTSQPITVPGLGAVTAVVAGGTHSLAQGADGTLRSWGYNAYGQLGIGNTTQQLSPVPVTAAAGLKGLTSGGVHVVGLKADATASAWGYNGFGALGNDSNVGATSPVTVLGYNRGAAPLGSYAYDGDGLRSSKTVAGTTSSFTWDSSSGLPLLIDDGTTAYVYGPDGLPLEQIGPGNAVTWHHHDQLGSTRTLTNATGAVTGSATYDPHGRLTASTGTISRLGFAGEYTDIETGYSYLRARYYDPTTAQFLSRDPLEVVTGEAYGYAGNNPLNAVDPTGLCLWCGAAVAGGIGGALGDIMLQLAVGAIDGCFKGIDWRQVAMAAVAGAAMGGAWKAIKLWRAARVAPNTASGVRLRPGTTQSGVARTYDTALNPQGYIDDVASAHGINLRGSGQQINAVYNPNLVSAGRVRAAAPNVIEIGPLGLSSSDELARTLAHELNHARSFLRGGSAPEATAYGAEDMLSAWLRGSL